MSGMISRLLAVAHLLPVLSRDSEAAAAAGRGVPSRARRITPAAAPARPKQAAPSQLAAPEVADEEMRGDSPEARARCRERARCAAIVTSAAGLKHPGLAYGLAFKTRASRAEALEILHQFDTGFKTSRWSHLKDVTSQTDDRWLRRGRPVH